MNYSEETTKYMVEKYKASPERETVEDLAKELITNGTADKIIDEIIAVSYTHLTLPTKRIV